MLNNREIQSAKSCGWTVSEEAGAVLLHASTRSWLGAAVGSVLLLVLVSSLSGIFSRPDSPDLFSTSLAMFLGIGCAYLVSVIAVSLAGRIEFRITPNRVQAFAGVGPIGRRWSESNADVANSGWETRRGRFGSFDARLILGNRRRRLSEHITPRQIEWFIDFVRRTHSTGHGDTTGPITALGSTGAPAASTPSVRSPAPPSTQTPPPPVDPAG